MASWIRQILPNRKNQWFYVIAIAAIATSCNKVNVNFGDSNTNDPNIVFIDTMSSNLSTFKADSFVTSSSGTLLLGQQADTVFGNMNASSYFQLGTPGTGQIQSKNFAFLDSARFLMKPTGTYYGDTLANFSFGLYQVTDKMQFQYNQFAFYNTSSFNTQPNPILTYTTTISPYTKLQVRVPVPDAFANDLFAKLKGDSNQIIDNAQFLAYIPGFYIKPINTNNAVWSFAAADTSLMIRLYYHYSTPFPVSATADFKLINTSNQFNHIAVNRTGLPAMQPFNATSTTPVPISSTLTGNKSYIQTAGGLQLKIDFPSLRSLRVENKYQKIMKATLYIRPYGYRYNGMYTLPKTLSLETANVNNAPTGTVVNNLSGSPQTLAPLIDQLYGINTYYVFDVTRYVTSVMNSGRIDYDGLLLASPGYGTNTSIDRLILANKNVATGQYPSVQLQIYALTF